MANLYAYIDGNFVEADYLSQIPYEPEQHPQIQEVNADMYYEPGFIESGYYEVFDPGEFIVDGYFEPGYIDSFVYGTSEILAYVSLSAQGEIVVPSGQVKEFESAITAEFTQTSTAGKIVDSSSELSVEFTQSTINNVVYGVELFAAAETSISAQVARIRENNVEVSGVFDIAVDYVRYRDDSVDAAALFDAIINGLRSRDTTMETQAAFSLAADAFRQQQSSADLLVNTALTANTDNTINVSAELTVETSVTAFGSTTKDINIIVEDFATLTGQIQRLRASSADVTSTADLTVDAVKIADIESDLTALMDAAIEGHKISGAIVDVDSDTVVDLDYIRVRNFSTGFGPSRTAKAITVQGNTYVDTSIYKLGAGSINFDGAADYLSLAHSTEFNLNNDNFTVECWIYNKENRESNITGVVDFPTQISQSLGFGFDTQWNWGFGSDADGRVVFVTKSSAGEVYKTIHQTSIALNSWNHIAFTYNKASNIVSIFVNGEKNNVAYPQLPANISSLVLPLRVGVSGEYYYGNVDELRISKSIRYVDSFTPSLQQYRNDADTILLVHGEPVIEDDGGVDPIAANFIVNASIGIGKTASADLHAESAQTAEITRIAGIAVYAEATTTLTCAVSNTRGVDIVVNDFALMLAQADVIRDFDVNLTANMTVQAQPTVVKPLGAALISVADINASAAKIVGSIDSLTSTTHLDANASAVVDITKQLSSAFTLTASVRSIHVNEIIYVIPSEPREFQIAKEYFSWTVEQEDRTYIVRR